MADEKLTALPLLTSLDADDRIYVVDRSDTTDDPEGTSKQIAKQNLHAGEYEFRSDGNIGSGRQYLFMDQSAWSAANGGAAVADANNFHHYDPGGGGICRVEFETDVEMQFYIEGGSGEDAWYGLQEGSTTHWSFGSNAGQSGRLDFCPQFGLANPVMTLSKDGALSIVSSFDLTADANVEAVATITNTANSSATAGSGLRLRHNDGAAMANGHRLGFVLFAGAENASDGYGYASGFESFATEAWSASANGCNFVINVTANGNGSRQAALTLTSDQATVESGVIEMGASGPTWRTGSGTPEGAVTAPVGSLFTRTDGGANTTLYVKESGAGNTGWVAK